MYHTRKNVFITLYIVFFIYPLPVVLLHNQSLLVLNHRLPCYVMEVCCIYKCSRSVPVKEKLHVQLLYIALILCHVSIDMLRSSYSALMPCYIYYFYLGTLAENSDSYKSDKCIYGSKKLPKIKSCGYHSSHLNP